MSDSNKDFLTHATASDTLRFRFTYTAGMALADAQRYWFRETAKCAEAKAWVTPDTLPSDCPHHKLYCAIYRRIETAARKGITFVEFGTLGSHSLFADLCIPHENVHVELIIMNLRTSGGYKVLTETKTGFHNPCPTITAIRIEWN